MRAGWSKPSTWMTGRRTRLESASIEIVHPLKGMRECTLVIGPVALFAETSRNARGLCKKDTRRLSFVVPQRSRFSRFVKMVLGF